MHVNDGLMTLADAEDWYRDMAYMENLVKDSLKNVDRGGGPPREMNQDREDKKSLEAVKHLEKMLSDLERSRGYKNSPTLFGEQLAKELETWKAPPEEGKLLQYVDDILIATRTKEACVAWTVSLLNFLGLQGYRVSKKKAKVVKQKVIYLGYKVSAGQRSLGQSQKKAICQTPKPQTVKELRTFLGFMGWCRLWIYNYGLFVKPFYELIATESRDIQWTKEATQAFNQLKKALMSAPALGLPDVSKPFLLFSHEKQGIALGILAQDLGPYRRAVAYFSKQLDTAAKGWPGCLRAVAAVIVNIQEACKFTLGQKMTVLVSHTVSAVLEVKGGHWLSPQRFLKYQAIMVEQDDVEIVVTNIVNPASFLSGNQGEPVEHDCLETIEATYSSRPDLKDTPLENAEVWFTDGSSYVISGKRHAGYAVTTCKEVIESGPLPTNTSAQKAEIVALTRALELAKGKEIYIYTDSKYAFGVVHAHGAIWRERGLLNSQGKNIKHASEILQLLEAVQLPEKVVIMHIKAHQRINSELEEGNELADRKAKEAAKIEIINEAALIPDGQISLEDWDRKLHYLDALLDDGLKMLENARAQLVDDGDPVSKTMSMNKPLRDAENWNRDLDDLEMLVNDDLMTLPDADAAFEGQVLFTHATPATSFSIPNSPMQGVYVDTYGGGPPPQGMTCIDSMFAEG
ncbi:uncharacterized protein LOC144247010 [Lonchura striata]